MTVATETYQDDRTRAICQHRWHMTRKLFHTNTHQSHRDWVALPMAQKQEWFDTMMAITGQKGASW